jgi:hypothetical protein
MKAGEEFGWRNEGKRKGFSKCGGLRPVKLESGDK